MSGVLIVWNCTHFFLRALIGVFDGKTIYSSLVKVMSFIPCGLQKGLRTLAVARRVLPDEEYAVVDRKVRPVSQSHWALFKGGGGGGGWGWGVLYNINWMVMRLFNFS